LTTTIAAAVVGRKVYSQERIFFVRRRYCRRIRGLFEVRFVEADEGLGRRIESFEGWKKFAEEPVASNGYQVENTVSETPPGR